MDDVEEDEKSNILLDHLCLTIAELSLDAIYLSFTVIIGFVFRSS